MCLRSALIIALTWMIGLFAPNPIQPGMGLSAQAEPDYYTRKRVDGVWITGKFRRTASTIKTVQVASTSPTPLTGTNSAPPTVPALPSMVGLAFPSAVASSPAAEFADTSGDPHREGLRSGLEQLARKIAEAQ